MFLIEKIWILEELLDDWNKGFVIIVFKKGDFSMCDNWRGIILFLIFVKVFCKIILDRLVRVVDFFFCRE